MMRLINQSPMNWSLTLLLCLGLISAETETRVFDLPSMTMTLSTKQTDYRPLLFEDSLTASVYEHISDFYSEKLEMGKLTSSVITLDHVGISSNYVWTETGFDSDLMRHFDLEGYYDCQLKITLEYEGYAPLHISQSQMELFFVEAFQQGNYWTLVHKFLSDEVLTGISDVEISVISDGYIAFGKQDPTDIGHDGDKWHLGTMAGVFFATFFCLALVGLWAYMFYHLRKRAEEDKESTSTDEDSIDCDLNLHDVDDASTGSWMDTWANTMTSIPLREPVKNRRRNRYRPTPKSAHNPSLDCISEGADEDASLASASSRSSRRSLKNTSALSLGLNTLNEDESVASVSSRSSYDCIRTSLSMNCLTNIEEENVEPPLPNIIARIPPRSGRRY